MTLYKKRERVKYYSISLTDDERKLAKEMKRKEDEKSTIRKKFDLIEKHSRIRASQKRISPSKIAVNYHI